MTTWPNRRTLMAALLILGAGMLQGSVHNPCGPYPAYGGHGYVAPVNDRGREGGGNDGGGMM
jgi:hypothetical protein